MENIRNAVRVFAFRDDKVLCIEYKNDGFYDMPGGKIEENETEIDACIRELEEETGLKADKLNKIGICTIYYPHINKTYILNTFIAEEVFGKIRECEENYAFWVSTKELISKEKRFAITHLLDENFRDVFEKENMNIKFICDENHNIKEVVKKESEENENI